MLTAAFKKHLSSVVIFVGQGFDSRFVFMVSASNFTPFPIQSHAACHVTTTFPPHRVSKESHERSRGLPR